ncbi:putative ShK domain-like-containing protein [Homarus americanus]|uniref:Putative ShK domain-like-containing protein n=1 Tax=Homarus americanus TaxID=6706 RepID=A0A8J5MUF5_HOMAM|nr:putative ShK domain-like-containing protein [Homarus americanus]
MGCSDRDPRCSLWAGKGECYKNRGYMHVHCAESCHQCVVQDATRSERWFRGLSVTQELLGYEYNTLAP